MAKIKLILAILILFTIYENSSSQQIIEIIFFNGDTIREEMSGKGFKYSKDSIYLSTNNITRYFFPSEISQIRSGEINLVSDSILTPQNGVVVEFIEPLITGYISLYQSYDASGKKVFYLQEKDSVIYYIPKKYFKGYINLMFRDCQSLNILMSEKSLNRFEYKINDWLLLVNYYNECKGFGSISIAYKEPVLKYKQYVTLGGSASVISINKPPYKDKTFNPKYYPYAGAAFGLEYFNCIGLYIAANFCRYGSESDFIAKGFRKKEYLYYGVAEVNVDVNLKYSLYVMELPMYIRTKLFSSKKISPYFEFGPMISTIFLNRSSALAVDDYIDPGSYEDKILFNTFKIGKYISGGIEFELYNRIYSANFGYTNIKYDSQPILSYGFSSGDASTFANNYHISLRMNF